MTPDEADALAALVLAAIEARGDHWHPRHVTDRRRVALDVEGLRRHHASPGTERCDRCWAGQTRTPHRHGDTWWPCPDAQAYTEGLRRTARLYAVPAVAA